MGAANSSEIKNVVGVVNNVSNEVVNRSITEGNAVSQNIQTLDVTFGPNSEINCPFNANNKIAVNQQVNISSVFNSASNVQNALQNMLTQIASSSQEAVSQFLSTSASVNVSKSDLISSISNDIQTKVTNENITSCKNFVTNIQNGKFEFLGKYTCPPGTNITINQDIINDQITQCLSQTFFNVIASNDLVNQVVQKAETKQIAKTEGIFSFLSIGGIVGAIAVIVIVILIIGVGIYFYTKSKKGGGPKGISTTSVKKSLPLPVPKVPAGIKPLTAGK